MDQERIAEMLKSIDAKMDYPNDAYSKAAVMRAMLGSIDVPTDESSMIALCECGWHGTMVATRKRNYDNGEWAHRSGRRGMHWHCPECDRVIWKYYHTIN
jgi:hypothetical protein